MVVLVVLLVHRVQMVRLELSEVAVAAALATRMVALAQAGQVARLLYGLKPAIARPQDQVAEEEAEATTPEPAELGVFTAAARAARTVQGRAPAAKALLSSLICQ